MDDMSKTHAPIEKIREQMAEALRNAMGVHCGAVGFSELLDEVRSRLGETESLPLCHLVERDELMRLSRVAREGLNPKISFTGDAVGDLEAAFRVRGEMLKAIESTLTAILGGSLVPRQGGDL